MSKLIIWLTLLMVPIPVVGWGAERVYFTIISGAGENGRFEVTDALIAKVGTKTYQAMLPGMDDTLHKVRGPLVRDLLKAAGAEGAMAYAKALDNYEVEIPSADFHEFDVIAAIEVDGKPMTVRDKGPAWIVYPSGEHVTLRKNAVYEARSIWQLKELKIK